jgi:hypothetical protein
MISDFSAEARTFGKMALDTLAGILQGGQERNRLVAAREILDRGYGRPTQAVDVVLMKINGGAASDPCCHRGEKQSPQVSRVQRP